MSASVLSKGQITELCYEQVLMLDGSEHLTLRTVELGRDQL